MIKNSDSNENYDEYMLDLENSIVNKIGKEFITLIEMHLVEIDSKFVLLVECGKSKDLCFFKKDGKKIFYYRGNVSTYEFKTESELNFYIQNYM